MGVYRGRGGVCVRGRGGGKGDGRVEVCNKIKRKRRGGEISREFRVKIIVVVVVVMVIC